MDNCLQKKSTKLLKKLVLRKLFISLFVFIQILSGAQAATYTWVGGTVAADGKQYWSEPYNWTSSDGGTSYPGENDIVFIGKTAEIFVDDSGAKAKGLSLANNGLSTSFDVTLTGTGTLEIGEHDFGGGEKGIITVRPSATGAPDTELSNIFFDCTVNAKSLVMHSGGNVTINKDKTVTINSINNIGGGDPSTEIIVDGNLFSNSIALSDVTTRTLKVNPTGSVNSGSITGSNNSVTNNGIVVVTSSIGENLINGASSGSTIATTTIHSWIGDNDTEWNNPNNWNPQGVPDTGDIVVINSGAAFYPIFTSTLSNLNSIGNIIINDSASLTIRTDTGELPSNIVGNGTLIIDEGSEYSTTSEKLIKVKLHNYGSLIFDDNTSFNKDFENNGIVEFHSETTFKGTVINNSSANIVFWWITTAEEDFINSGEIGFQAGEGDINFKKNFSNTGKASFYSGLQIYGDFYDGGDEDSNFRNIHVFDSSIPSTNHISAVSNINSVVINKDNSGEVIFDGNLTKRVQIDTQENNFEGTIKFTGDKNQLVNFANRVCKSISVDKSGGTLVIDDELFTSSFEQINGNVEFNIFAVENYYHTQGNVTFKNYATFWDYDPNVASNTPADFHSATVTFSGSDNSNPVTFYASKFIAGSVICTDDTYFDINILNGNIEIDGNIGSEEHPFKKLKLNANEEDDKTVSVNGKIYASELEIDGKDVFVKQGINANSLVINSTDNSVNLGKEIILTGSSDFVIDYPITLTDDTIIDVAGKIIIKNSDTVPGSIGSINSDSTPRALTLKASEIQIKNTAGLGTTSPLSQLTIGGNLSIEEDVTFNTGSGASAGDVIFTNTGTLSVTNGKTLTFTGDNTKILNGDWTFDGAVPVNNLIIDNDGTNSSYPTTSAAFDYPITIATDKTLTLNGSLTTNGSQTFNGDVSFTGDSVLNASGTGAQITFTQTTIDGIGKKLTLPSATAETLFPADMVVESSFESAGQLTCTGDVTFKDDVILADNGFTQAASRSVKLTAENKSAGEAVELGGSNAFNTLIIYNDTNITGSNTIDTLKTSTLDGSSTALGGKTITFTENTTQTVTNSLTLTGSSDTNTLALKSDTANGKWTLKYTGSGSNSDLKLENLTVTNSINSADTTLYPVTSTDGGGNTGWAFIGMPYRWLGGKNGSETSWAEPENWQPKSIPGKGSSVIIQKGRSYYPKLTGDLDLYETGAGEGEITIEEGTSSESEGKLYISGHTVTVKNLTNNGLINLTGIAGQIVTTGGTKTLGDNSTVEYEGTGTLTSANLIWGTDYANLIIKRNAELDDNLTAKTISIEKPFTFNGSSITTTGAQIYKDTVTLTGTTTLAANNGTDNSTIEFDGDVTGTTLTINANTIINTNAINTNAAQTYNGTVTLQKAATLTAKSGSTNLTIEFDGDVTGTANTGTTLTINANTNINADAINTNAAQTYNGTVTLQKATTLTAKSGSTNQNITFTRNVTGTTNAGTSLTITANTIINTDAINTNAAQTYNGTVTLQKATTLTAKNGTTNKNITFEGNVTGNSANNIGLTINADTILNAFAINTSNAQNYNGAITLKKAATLTAKRNNTRYSITFTGDVTGITNTGTSLTVDANAIINTDAINTNAAQTYNGTVTLLKAVTLTANNGTSNQNITFSGDVNGTTNVDTSLTINADTRINTNGINTNAAQTYNGTVTLLKAATLTAYNGTTNQNITFVGDVTGTTNADTSLIINADTIINTDAINTNAAQTYNGTITLQKAATLTAKADTTNKNITFTGDVTGTTNANTSLIINADTIINTDAVNTNADQTYNGTVSLQKAVTLTAKADPTNKKITFAGNVAGTNAGTSLTVDANAIINTVTINTNATQIYKGTVQVDKEATITSSTDSLIFQDDITISENVILNASTTDKEIDFAKNISGSTKKLTVNTPLFKSIATAGNNSSAILNELVFSQNTSIQTEDSTTINLTVPTISGQNKTVILPSGTKLAFAGNVSVEPSITAETGSTLTAPSVPSGINPYSMTFKSNINFANETFKHSNGTVILNPPATVNIITVEGESIFYNLKAENLGNKTIKFEQGKTQTVEGKLTLTGTSANKLSLRSTTTDNSQWKIKCTGANEHTIQYVDIKDGWNISETGTPTEEYNLFALNSNDSGNNKNWNFPGMSYLWKTTATSTDWNTASNWEQNSIPGKGAVIEIPAGCANYPKLEAPLDLNATYNSHDYKGIITIKPKEAGKVEGNLDLAGCNLILDTITNYGHVSLTGALNQTISGKMKNEVGSTVEYYGTGTTPTNFAWDGDNGTNTAGKQYVNLILNQNTSSSDILVMSENLTIKNPALLSGNVTVGGNLSIAEAVELSGAVSVTGTTTIYAGTGKTVSLDNTSNSFAEKVIAGSSTGTSFIAGAVILRAGSLITLEDNANADSLTVNSAVKLQKVTTSDNQTYNGTVTVNGTTNLIATDADKHIYFNNNVSGTGTLSAQAMNININCDKIESSGTQTYTGAVALDKNTELKSTSGGINFTSTIDGAKTLKLTSSSGTTFGGLVGGTVGAATNLSSLEVNGLAIINTSSVTTSGAQTYKGAVSLGEDTTLTSTGSNLALNTTLNGAHTITFSVPANAENTITVTGQVGGNSSIPTPPSITIAQAGKVTFNETVKINDFTLTKANSTSFAKAVDITTFTDDTTNHAGSVTFAAGGTIHNDVTFNTNNTVSFTGTMNIGAEGSRKDLSHINGNTLINGTLNAKDVTLSNTTFAGTMNAANVQMAVTSTSGTINATTTQLGNLTLTGDTTITTTGTQDYNGTINDSTAGEHTLTLASGTSQITFLSDVGQTAAPKVLTVNGPIAVNCSKVTTTVSQNYNAAVTSTGSIELQSAAINLKCATVITNGSQTYDGPVILLSDTKLNSDTGNIHLTSSLTGAYKYTIEKTNDATFDGAVDVTSFIITEANDTLFKQAVTTTDFKITQANDTQFNQSVTTTNFDITQANDTQFDSTVTAATFKITQAANTTFDGAVTIASFIDATTAGNISFNAGGTISNATGTTFNTNDLVTFGDNQADIMTFGSASSYADLKHISGDTSITGMFKAANITLAQTTGGQMIIENSGLLTTTDGSSLTYGTSFSQNGTGNSKLGGSFTGNGNASFAKNLQIYGSSQADFGATGKTINVGGNLIVVREAADKLDILSNLSVAGNLVLYKGAVTAKADLSAEKDILILGNTYSTSDTSTGITDEYSYTTPRHADWSQPNYTENLLPDGSALPASSAYSATLSVTAGKTISAAKNFYANGTNLSTSGSSGQWLLRLPDITNPVNGFAEAYHSVVSGCKVTCTDGSTNGSKARLATLECTDSGDGTSTPNTNVEFEDFQITKAYTVRDNAIRVEFNQPVRYHATTINQLNFHDASDSVTTATRFTGFYSDPDCQHELTSDITQSYTDEASGKTYWYFYIKAAPQDSASTGAWNTDASGKNSGAANGKSSDRYGIHHTALACLDFPRALAGSGTTASLSFIITDRWGKRLNNYSRRVPKATAAEAAYGSKNSSDPAFEVTDKTGPVMWTVRTGQELHTAYSAATGEAGQHSYDSHNFLEFRYSEPVDFTPLNSGETENIRVTNDFGAIKEANINQEADSLTFAGLAQFTAPAGSKLLLHTGYNGTTSKYMNALYRTDEYSIRLSVAGWTDGTVTDYSGNEYKNWTGYIEGAKQFTGAKAKPVMQGTSLANNPLILDLEGNAQIEYAVNKIEPQVYSDSSSENTSGLLPLSPDLYSAWDISEPVFTPLRFSVETAWGENEFSEAIGNTNGSGSTLDRIDFHFFDNTPAYNSSDTAEWFTETGWCIPGSEGTKDYLYDSSYTYAADIIGGARQFDSISARRTAGGIRLSTKLNAAQGFKYSTDPFETHPATEFAPGKANVHSTVISQLFTGSSEPQHSANDPDGLYLGLGITDTALPVETSFAFSYNASAAYLTDLAGNRLRNKTSRTIDRTPPSFDIILSPVDQKQIYIVFVKEIVTQSSNIKFQNPAGNPKDYEKELKKSNFLNILPACFQIISINSDGSFTASTDLQIDADIPARIIERYSDNHFTCVCLTLNKEITSEDIQNLYIQLNHHPAYPETTPDPWTSNSNARVTFIQDQLGNYMQMYSAHALSDFAIGLINPLYAYSSDITENDESVMKSLYEEGSWAVHDFDADQQNYGTLPAAHPAAIVTQQNDGTEDGSQLPQNVRIYLSDSPDQGSVSTQFNKDFKTSLRVWLPDLTDGIFRALSAKNNSHFNYADSRLLNADSPADGLIFDLPLSMINSWKSGDQISFMFGLTESDGSPVKIFNSPYYDNERRRYDFALSTAVPLYSLRMHDTTDIGTLDLWSFRLKGITEQRGGVTILNNVINPLNGENTLIKVNLPEDGRLNVSVLTADGNVITYLNRGTAKQGEHYFTWDGKNRNGTPVARGIYFIRVTGSDIDETRKVMIVKD